jgi:BirA family biotin operon repressor/biotin-[acetyl-CoA-carboxylase] ligase
MQQFQLSMCVAVSACRFLGKYAGCPITIKWPNDLYRQDRKAGGILIENILGTKRQDTGQDEVKTPRAETGSGWQWAVVGIGININQDSFPAGLPNPVSLRQITGKPHDPCVLAKELHQSILQGFRSLVISGPQPFYSQYNELLYRKGEVARFRKDNRVFEATVQGVSMEGRLRVRHALDEEWGFGEVEWLVPPVLPEK